MTQAQSATLQNYLDYAFQRNGDSGALEDLDDNFMSVKNALLNLSADPNWPHYREEYRITTVQPYSTGTVDLTDDSTTLTGNATLWATAGIDNTWVLKVDGEDTEYPVASVGSETGIVLKYPYVDKGRTALAAQSYKLIKRFYVLPNNFRELIAIKRATASICEVRLLSPDALRERAQLSDNGGTPEYYTVLNLPADGRKAIRFLPYPEGDYAFQYDLEYLRWPTALSAASPSDVVDWPEELRGLLEKAIEVEIARKNRDPIAEDIAIKALNRAMPVFERGSLEDGGNHRLYPFGINEDQLELDRIFVDGSGA
jgi:hypothetical protein